MDFTSKTRPIPWHSAEVLVIVADHPQIFPFFIQEI